MNQADSKFLVFKVGDELFASPLLSIREVLEYQNPKPMPNMVPHFSGVINVRGAIVGVVDLRTKFLVNSTPGAKNPLLLCDTPRGTIATIVDSVEKVQEILDADIETNPPIQVKVDVTYLKGVARVANQLITIVDIHELLNDEEYAKVSGV